jgi:hypothetical protein
MLVAFSTTTVTAMPAHTLRRYVRHLARKLAKPMNPAKAETLMRASIHSMA